MKKQITKVRAPNGFLFRIREVSNQKYVYVHLLDKKKKNEKVGEIRLYKQDNGFYETHSDLDEDYRNLGLGVKLYGRAIQWCLEHGYKIRSTGASSELAQRVWRGNRIRQLFRIVTKKFKRNPEPGNDTWFAYAKLK